MRFIDQCEVEPDSRKECGYMGIKQPECEGKGCCWRPLENGSKAPWCFFPAKKGTPISLNLKHLKTFIKIKILDKFISFFDQKRVMFHFVKGCTLLVKQTFNLSSSFLVHEEEDNVI